VRRFHPQTRAKILAKRLVLALGTVPLTECGETAHDQTRRALVSAFGFVQFEGGTERCGKVARRLGSMCERLEGASIGRGTTDSHGLQPVGRFTGEKLPTVKRDRALERGRRIAPA